MSPSGVVYRGVGGSSGWCKRTTPSSAPSSRQVAPPLLLPHPGSRPFPPLWFAPFPPPLSSISKA
jgi:hypothetical protein